MFSKYLLDPHQSAPHPGNLGNLTSPVSLSTGDDHLTWPAPGQAATAPIVVFTDNQTRKKVSQIISPPPFR